MMRGEDTPDEEGDKRGYRVKMFTTHLHTCMKLSKIQRGEESAFSN